MVQFVHLILLAVPAMGSPPDEVPSEGTGTEQSVPLVPSEPEGESLPPAPPDAFLAVFPFHVRLGSSGVAWNTGAMVESRLFSKWGFTGSAALSLGLVVAIDTEVGLRRHPDGFEKGFFSELGLGAAAVTGNVPTGGSLSARYLLGNRFSKGKRAGDSPLTTDLAAGVRLDCDAMQMLTGEPSVVPGILVQLDVGFQLWDQP